jgi:hypothetical protein
MDFPVANALELGELLLRRFDRPFSAGRRSNEDRALAAAEKPIVSRDLIHETDAITRHLSSPNPVSHTIMARRSMGLDDLDQFRRTQRQRFAHDTTLRT